MEQQRADPSLPSATNPERLRRKPSWLFSFFRSLEKGFFFHLRPTPPPPKKKCNLSKFFLPKKRNFITEKSAHNLRKKMHDLRFFPQWTYAFLRYVHLVSTGILVPPVLQPPPPLPLLSPVVDGCATVGPIRPVSFCFGFPQIDEKDVKAIVEVSEYVFRLRYQGTTCEEQKELARRATGLLPVEICRLLYAGSLDKEGTDMGRLTMFSAHDNTILSLLAHLGFRDVPIPYFAAHVVFELHIINGISHPFFLFCGLSCRNCPESKASPLPQRAQCLTVH